MYLQLRRRLWYALHEIPADVRPVLGRPRFCRSLETENRKTAERRAAILEQRWKREIEQARGAVVDPLEEDARYWQRVLREAPDDEKPVIRELIFDEAQARVDRAADQAGLLDQREPGYDDLPVHEEVARFCAVATGKLVRMDEHLDEWLATLKNEAKSKDMKKSTVTKFAETFPYVQDVKRKEVQRWVNGLVQNDGKKAATVRRALSEVRGYWSYLISIEVVPEDSLPFEKLILPKDGAKEAVRDERRAFTPSEVVTLLRAAEAKDDPQLADLIRLGMWTGARLEELCALKVAQVGNGFFEVVDAKSKAGWRRVPVHPKLAPTLARLVEISTKAGDEYVLAGLSRNKYGDRSNAIGKRFGRLKDEAGFGPQHVFHSIRHTVATQWKSARVDVSIAADILGHEHDGMTFGQYGDVAYWKTLVDVVELLDYPEG